MTILLEHAFDLAVELSPPHEMGACATGTRRIIPIVGGTAAGPLINGRVLDIGADWQTVTANHVAELDARYAIETADGAVIEVISRGIRHASRDVAERIRAGEDVPRSEYYMRTAGSIAAIRTMRGSTVRCSWRPAAKWARWSACLSIGSPEPRWPQTLPTCDRYGRNRAADRLDPVPRSSGGSRGYG